jgi:hypothetical protein
MTRVPIGPGIAIPLRYANRHGLITGPTGSGKTVSLMTLAEGFSRAGVPVFVADVKGDIAALARSCPVDLLDLYGQAGRPIRLTVSTFGPDLLSRALELSDTQSAIVEIAFAYARDRRMPLNSLADFRSVLGIMLAARAGISATYGHVTAGTVGVVQRALLRLDTAGGGAFFGQPPYAAAELMHNAGRISILAAHRLLHSPRVYSAFLLWLLSDLYRTMPEIGDQAQPRLVLFFDEAHLLFEESPPALLRRIEQTVRLIRSKGVGIYFVSQSRDDVPAIVRDQLATRIEHDRALPVGSARVSTMTDRGTPAATVTARIAKPSCAMGPLTAADRIGLTLPAPIYSARPAAPETHSRGIRGDVLLAGMSVAGIGAATGLWASGYLPAALAVAAGLALGIRGMVRRMRG